LEKIMDECQKDLAPLKSFILPGGGPIHGFLHLARTVCRRAERELLVLSRVEPIGEGPLRYLNRLSDLFFVLGRWVGKHMGEQEYLWERGLSAHGRRRAKRSVLRRRCVSRLRTSASRSSGRQGLVRQTSA